MNVLRRRTAGEFLSAAGEWLGRAEAENNLILGIVSGLLRHPEEAWLLTVEAEGRTSGAAVMTPPRNLVLTAMPEAAIEALTEALRRWGAPVPGVVGPRDASRSFVRQWGREANLTMSERIYQCGRVAFDGGSRGRMAEATPDLEPMLADWGRQFCIDARIDREAGQAPELVRRLLAEGRLYVWMDGAPVSMAARSADTPRGSRVSFVYTPADLRRRGYATSLVASLTHRILDSGGRFAFLTTDLANPTSNAIYQRIGYRPVSDAEMWEFTAPAGPRSVPPVGNPYR